MIPEKTSRLVARNLQKTFKKRQVVKDFSLDIESGEVVGLLQRDRKSVV